jgi:hypothetical protein
VRARGVFAFEGAALSKRRRSTQLRSSFCAEKQGC